MTKVLVPGDVSTLEVIVDSSLQSESEFPFNCRSQNSDGSVGAEVGDGICMVTGNAVRIEQGKCPASCEHRAG